MKTPTIEEIISKVHYVTGEECGVSGAIIIAEMFDYDVEYKPLSELAGDRESCEKIFQFFVSSDVEMGEVVYNPQDHFLALNEFKPKYYDEHEPMHRITLHEPGNVYWTHGGEFILNFNVFALVDLIRELGYSLS